MSKFYPSTFYLRAQFLFFLRPISTVLFVGRLNRQFHEMIQPLEADEVCFKVGELKEKAVNELIDTKDRVKQ